MNFDCGDSSGSGEGVMEPTCLTSDLKMDIKLPIITPVKHDYYDGGLTQVTGLRNTTGNINTCVSFELIITLVVLDDFLLQLHFKL